MGSKIYVGNLSFETSERDLHDAFGPFGSVTEVHIASDRYTGRPRGFAFVTFATDDEAKLAIEKMNGSDFGGRPLTVNEAKPKEETGTVSAAGRTYTSPNRKPGAFHARGNRRH
jgi:cold-inducible RNA-binding protein